MMGMPGEVTVDLTGPVAPRDRARRRLHLRHRDARRRPPRPHVRPRPRDRHRHRGRALAERHVPPRRPRRRHRPRRRGRPARRHQDRLRPPIGASDATSRFVLDVDRSTPPTLVWNGEGLSLEKLPADRSRVIYPAEPLAALDDIDGAIRHALLHPLDQDPLPTLLFPGMKLTIAFDDISLPLPPMRRPDVRQRVIEAVLDLAAEAGVDDVHLVCALALHRRMTEAELRHAIGDRVYDAFEPRGMLSQHDAEDPDNLLYLGTTDHGEEVEINKRAATSDLLVYVNINLVAMDGGWKSTATGLASYRSLRHHHNPTTMEASHSFMDQHRSELHKSNWRMGKVLRRLRREGLPDRDDAEHRHVPVAVRLPRQAGVGVVAEGPGDVRRHGQVAVAGTDPAGPQDPPLDRGAAPDDEHPGRRGRGRAPPHDRARLRPAPRRGPGPDRHPDDGHPVHLPVQRQLDHEPDPRDVHGARVPVQPLPRASRWCARAAS